MRILLTISAVVLLETTAGAADAVTAGTAPVIIDEMQQPFDWTGAYAGIQGGYGWMDGYFETPGYDPLDADLDGRIFGAFVGFNRQFDSNLVLGIEGDLEHNWNDVSLQPIFGTIEGGADWQGSVRTRIGYALDRVLVYATAGWTATHIEAELIGVTSTTESFHGYTAGAGIDYAVTDQIFGRLEYRYNDFGDGKLDFGAALVDADVSQQTVRMGLGIKF